MGAQNKGFPGIVIAGTVWGIPPIKPYLGNLEYVTKLKEGQLWDWCPQSDRYGHGYQLQLVLSMGLYIHSTNGLWSVLVTGI